MSIRGSKKVGKIKISSREYARAKENFLKNCHSPFTKEWLTQFNKSEKKREQNNTNHISGKKILCINTGELFNSITLAAEWCNTSTSNISEYLSNSSLTFAGHHPITGEKLQWKYIF